MSGKTLAAGKSRRGGGPAASALPLTGSTRGAKADFWRTVRLKRLFRFRKQQDVECRRVLSVYRDHGVIEKASRDDNFNKTPEDLSKYQLVEPGDLVINKMKAWQGSLGISNFEGITSPDYAVYQSLGQENLSFLHYLLRCQPMASLYHSISTGVRPSQWRVELGKFEQIVLRLPPLPVQRAIASFLDRETSKIDALVSDQRRLIALLAEKRQAVIGQAVTRGLDTHAPTKPSGIDWLGDVPEHWNASKLSRIAFMQEGPGLRKWQFTDSGTRVICVTNISESGIDFSAYEKFISEEEYRGNYQHFTVAKNDILLSSSGNSWGKVAVYEGDEQLMLNTSTIRVNTLDAELLSRQFLSLCLQSSNVREQLGQAMTGSCQPNFGPTHLKQVWIVLPPRNEQNAIVAAVADKVQRFDKLEVQANQAIDLLTERRTALISAAATGKIDVRDSAYAGNDR